MRAQGPEQHGARDRRSRTGAGQGTGQHAAADPAEIARLRLEHELYASGVTLVAGVDEAGAGAWAGPVVAAAVLLGPGVVIRGANDSKQLTARQREALATEIRARALGVGVGSAEVAEIFTLNILRATLLAMERAVAALPRRPEHLLVDYRQLRVGVPCTALVRGDSRCHAIACASIIAKTHRDGLLVELERRYPGYELARHKGYGTAAHRRALERLGPSPQHRLGYKPLRALAAGARQLSLV